MGTTLVINEASLYPKSTRTLKDICANGFHIETEEEYGKKYLLIIKHEESRKMVSERLLSFETRLYYTNIKALAAYTALKIVFRSFELFCLWHDTLDHPGIRMMRNIINKHNINVNNFPN